MSALYWFLSRHSYVQSRMWKLSVAAIALRFASYLWVIFVKMLLCNLYFSGTVSAFKLVFALITSRQRKFIDWKKTKLFRFRWNWVEEKKLRGIHRQISSLPPHTWPHYSDHFPLHYIWRGGKDYVDTITAVKCFRKGWEIIYFMKTFSWEEKFVCCIKFTISLKG